MSTVEQLARWQSQEKSMRREMAGVKSKRRPVNTGRRISKTAKRG